MDILSELVRQQHDQINTLTAKLSYLLSMFGLAEDEVSLTKTQSVSKITGAELSVSMFQSGAFPALQHTIMSNNDSTIKDLPSTVVEQSNEHSSSSNHNVVNTSYSNAVKRKPTAMAAFHNAVAKAVHVENKTILNRSRNVVVSGLRIIEGLSDHEQVVTLCEHDLNIRPDIVSCKRLGRLIDGRIQPLLVSLSSSDNASRIIKRAKVLRESSDITIRNSVYIN